MSWHLADDKATNPRQPVIRLARNARKPRADRQRLLLLRFKINKLEGICWGCFSQGGISKNLSIADRSQLEMAWTAKPRKNSPKTWYFEAQAESADTSYQRKQLERTNFSMSSTCPQLPKTELPQEQQPSDATAIIASNSLLAGKKSVLIDHDGTQYRLLVTRNNRLILQK